jgi:hypothetical protein
MKKIDALLLCAIAGSLAVLSSGCTATEGHPSNVSMIMPGTVVRPPAANRADDGFYHPPRDPQFNTARDQ